MSQMNTPVILTETKPVIRVNGTAAPEDVIAGAA